MGKTGFSEEQQEFINQLFQRIEAEKGEKKSWAQLEKDAGLPLRWLTNAKNRGGMPSVWLICKVADALGVSVDALCGREKPALSMMPEYRELLETFVDDLRQQLGVTGGNIFENAGK